MKPPPFLLVSLLFALCSPLLAQTAQQTNTNGVNIDTDGEANSFLTALARGTSISFSELGYLDGVSSNLQTQLNGKLSLSGGTMTGNLAMGGNNITGTGNISAGSLTIDTNTLFVDATNNRVGVGTVSPSRTFYVSGNIESSGFSVFPQIYCDVFKDSSPGNDALNLSARNLVASDGSTVNLSWVTAGTLSTTANFNALGAIELGHASDTTLSRSAAGKLAVEGVDLVSTAGTQTIAGAKTFSGQTELTGQAATATTSAVNVGMVSDLFIADHTSREQSVLGFSNTNVGWGSYVQNYPCEASIRVAFAVTGSSCLARANPNGTGLPVLTSGDPGYINWGNRLRVSFQCLLANSDANTVGRFQVGEDAAKTTISDLDQKGFGLKRVNSTIYVLAHDGTTLTSSNAGTLADGGYDILMESDGAGNIKLYINGTLTHTTSGGPTTNSSYQKNAVNFSVDNTAGTGIPWFNLYGTIKMKIGN